MPNQTKKNNLVGNFIRDRRESKGMSQRALGLLFDPPVTTQFISNIERGVTPLPFRHMSTLSKALSIGEEEMAQLLGQEYHLKISDLLGRPVEENANGTNGVHCPLFLEKSDFPFFSELYAAYCKAGPEAKREFTVFSKNLLKLS